MATQNDSPPKQNKRATKCSVFLYNEPNASQSMICHSEFFVERLRYEKPQVFTDLVLSNITRLIDLPGEEFAQLTGDSEPRLPSSSSNGFLRSFNFLKRKEKRVVFGAPLTEEGIAQIYQLIEYLFKNLHVEGLFRVPGNSLRQAALKEMLNAGADIDLETGDFHPNDVATLLKVFLGELPEPLLTHRHYHAHLKIGELTLFDDNGDKTNVPDKERQIETFQLLLMLLPPANRSLLKLLLDLLHHTARNQHANKMSAINLATMFAPHIIWPKNMVARDLQGDIEKLNNGVAFLIRHSQKLLKAPDYIKDYAKAHFLGSKALQSNDDMLLGSGSEDGSAAAVSSAYPSPSVRSNTEKSSESLSYTETALRELYQQVNSMPESAKKKKLIRKVTAAPNDCKQTKNTIHFHKNLLVKFEKQPGLTPSAESRSPFTRRHQRSRSFSGIIKKKVLGSQLLVGKENGGSPPSS
uniref:Rho GTPase-activating protein 19 n=1 Tax=Oryzias latipes TaxID=8090 RepID=A0A3P9HGG4_ORYLA